MDDVGSNEGAITDGELLKRTRCGDREAFGVLYERRHELVLAFLLKRTRNPEAGFLLPAGADEDETIRALRRVGGVLDDDGLAEECIGDLPAEEIDAAPVGDGAGIPVAKLAMLVALLVQARPHCPSDLQAEIFAALKDAQ